MAEKIVALTGGIGSGKSTVARVLEKKGFAVVDCDELARQVAFRPDVLAEIADLFGQRFVLQGKIDRRALATEIFCDEEKTQKLNGIFHGKVFELLKEIADREKGIVFAEVQVLTDGTRSFFDEIWWVDAPEEVRVARAMDRDGRSREQVLDIIRRQKHFEREGEKILLNDGDMEKLLDGVEKLLEQL